MQYNQKINTSSTVSIWDLHANLMTKEIILFRHIKFLINLYNEMGGVSSWRNGYSVGLRNRSTRVRTPVALLRSLSGKYPWERYEPPYPPSYGLNSTTTVLLGE